MYIKKEWICLITAISLCYCCYGQSILSSTMILSSARADLKPGLQQQRLQYISETNRGLPFAEQISIRTETDRFTVDRQEYLARLSVNGWSEMHHLKEMQSVELTAEQKTQRVYLHEALVDRYEAIANVFQVLEDLQWQHELLLVYEDKVTVLKKQASLNVKPDLEELIKAEYDVDDLMLKIDADQAELEQFRQLIGLLAPAATGDWILDTTHFITPAHIELIMGQLTPTVVQNPTLEQKQTKIEAATAAYNLEKAQSNQLLDFLQLRYAGRAKDPLDQELSIGVGFMLPFKGSSSVKMSELLIEKNNADQNAQIYQNELTRQMTLALQKIKSLATRYRLAKEHLEDSQARFTLDHVDLSYTEGPLTLLSAKEMQIKRRLSLLDIQRDMIEQYLKILDWSGALSGSPQVNYLSTELGNY